MKYILYCILALSCTAAGIAGTYVFFQGELQKSFLEGSIGEAASMSELLATVATNTENQSDLKDAILLISCRSSGAALEHFEENGIDTFIDGMSFDHASNARRLHQKAGLDKCY